MDAKKLFKYFLICGSAYFTAICGVILTVLAILTNDNTGIGIEPSRFLWVLALCFVFSLGSTVRHISAIPSIVGWIINAVCYIGGFLAFLVLFGVTFIPTIIFDAVFALIYAVIAIFVAYKEKGSRGALPSYESKKQASSRNKKSNDGNKAKGDQPYENLFS